MPIGGVGKSGGARSAPTKTQAAEQRAVARARARGPGGGGCGLGARSTTHGRGRRKRNVRCAAFGFARTFVHEPVIPRPGMPQILAAARVYGGENADGIPGNRMFALDLFTFRGKGGKMRDALAWQTAAFALHAWRVSWDATHAGRRRGREKDRRGVGGGWRKKNDAIEASLRSRSVGATCEFTMEKGGYKAAQMSGKLGGRRGRPQGQGNFRQNHASSCLALVWFSVVLDDGLELERRRIDAMPQVRWRLKPLALEHVPQMRATACAGDLHAPHAVRKVLVAVHRTGKLLVK